MMEIPTGQAGAAQEEPETDAGRNAAVDELTTAIMTGASPAEIDRLETSAAPALHDESQDGASGGEDAMPGDNPGEPAGGQPPGDGKIAERIRLTGLQERDKGLVNAANIIARTEGISFNDAWRRVNGEPGHDVRAQAGQQWQPDIADEHANAFEAERQHHLNCARELYEDLHDAESALWQEANRIATDPTHPDYDTGIAARANGPLMIAKLAAANLGIPGGAALRNDPSHAAQPAITIRPAAATKQSAPPAPRKSSAEVIRDSEARLLDALEGRTALPASRAERAYLRL